MKLFKITATHASFDEYESLVVIAESKERALEIAMKEPQPYDYNNENKFNVYFEFREEQYPLKIEEIPMAQEKIVVSEFINS